MVSIAKGLEPGAKRMSEVYDEELETRWSRSGARRWRPRWPRRQPCVAVFGCPDGSARGGGRGLPVAPLFGPHHRRLPRPGAVRHRQERAPSPPASWRAWQPDGSRATRTPELRCSPGPSTSWSTCLRRPGAPETALGLAGMGDLLVTSLGGRNRQYGEVLGTGADPKRAEEAMEARA